MTDGEPTIGEAVRRINEVSQQLSALALRMAQDRRDAAATYVPRELYEARHSFVNRRIDVLEAADEAREQADKERERTAAETRRQLLFITLGAFATGIVAIIVAVLTASGGATP